MPIQLIEYLSFPRQFAQKLRLSEASLRQHVLDFAVEHAMNIDPAHIYTRTVTFDRNQLEIGLPANSELLPLYIAFWRDVASARGTGKELETHLYHVGKEEKAYQKVVEYDSPWVGGEQRKVVDAVEHAIDEILAPHIEQEFLEIMGGEQDNNDGEDNENEDDDGEDSSDPSEPEESTV